MKKKDFIPQVSSLILSGALQSKKKLKISTFRSICSDVYYIAQSSLLDINLDLDSYQTRGQMHFMKADRAELLNSQ